MNLGAVFCVGNLTCSFSYATHLAHPVLCRPTHFNISGYASVTNIRIVLILDADWSVAGLVSTK